MYDRDGEVPRNRKRTGAIAGASAFALDRERADVLQPRAGVKLAETLYDLHCHLDFARDAHLVAQDAASLGIHALTCTVTPEGYERARATLAPWPNLRVGLGLHPWWVADGRCGEEAVARFEKLAAKARFIGEIGFDFAGARGEEACRARQVAALERALAACCEGGSTDAGGSAYGSAETNAAPADGGVDANASALADAGANAARANTSARARACADATGTSAPVDAGADTSANEGISAPANMVPAGAAPMSASVLADAERNADADAALTSDTTPKVISLHAVRAASDVLDALTRAGALKQHACVFHWFSGTSDELVRAVRAGCFFSVGPRMLKTKRGRAYARAIPARQLLLETDAPPRADTPWSAQTWRSELEEALRMLAETREENARDLAATLAQNSAHLLA